MNENNEILSTSGAGARPVLPAGNFYTGVPEVGKFYNVLCAKLKMIYDDDRIEYIPVHGPMHRDPQIGADWLHIHIDGRFIKTGTWVGINEGRTNVVIDVLNERAAGSRFEGFEIKRRKCYFKTTGVTPSDPRHFYPYSGERKGVKYWTWYKSMVGKSCKGRRCPHLGTQMDEVNGKLVCPLHNLIGSVKSERIITRPEVKIACG